MQRVVLIAQQGSGTNIFRALANSHPDITILDELFCAGRNFGETYKASYETVEQFLERKFKEAGTEIVGVDVKYNQVTKELQEYIDKYNVKVIHLLRDIPRTFLLHVNKSNKQQSFTLKELEGYCKKVNAMRLSIEKAFSHLNYTQLSYEELTKGRFIEEGETYEDVNKLLSNIFALPYYEYRIDKRHIHKELVSRF